MNSIFRVVSEYDGSQHMDYVVASLIDEAIVIWVHEMFVQAEKKKDEIRDWPTFIVSVEVMGKAIEKQDYKPQGFIKERGGRT